MNSFDSLFQILLTFYISYLNTIAKILNTVVSKMSDSGHHFLPILKKSTPVFIVLLFALGAEWSPVITQPVFGFL